MPVSRGGRGIQGEPTGHVLSRQDVVHEQLLALLLLAREQHEQRGKSGG